MPLVPTRIDGTHEAMPKGSRLPRRRPVRVSFGPPLDPGTLDLGPEALGYEKYRHLVEEVRARIVALGAAGHERPPEAAG